MASNEERAWQDAERKPRYVREMFADVARRYDLLNTVLSFNRHRAWRRQAVRMASLAPGDRALDVCTGTADFAIDLYRAVGSSGMVVGSDFCAPMLGVGKPKADAASHGSIRLVAGDVLRLPFREGAFDCVTVGFGIRNVADVRQAFAEMARVSRPGGRVVCLEFSTPDSPFWRALVTFYQMKVLPRVGGMLSRREAYTYLPESIRAFHSREQILEMMAGVGLADLTTCDLNLGSVCIYRGTKR